MNRKPWILVLCLVVGTTIALLAASLHDVTFEAGHAFGRPLSSWAPLPFQMPEGQVDVPLWKIVVLWLAIVAVLGLSLLLLSPEARRRLLRQLISLAVGVLMLLLALKYRILQFPELNLIGAGGANQSPSELATDLPVPTFEPPHISVWVAYGIGVLVLWAVLLLAWFSYRRWMRSRARHSADLVVISDIARVSLDELARGHPWRDVVIETYLKMGQVVSAQRGLYREAAATPREFAERLAGAGLPEGAVRELTALFELVRYGARASGEADGKRAIACLESIAAACGAIA